MEGRGAARGNGGDATLFVPITKFTTVDEYDDYFENTAKIDDRE